MNYLCTTSRLTPFVLKLASSFPADFSVSAFSAAWRTGKAHQLWNYVSSKTIQNLKGEVCAIALSHMFIAIVADDKNDHVS